MSRIKDAEGNEESQEIDVSDWITGTWDRSATGEAEGTILTGQLNLDNVKRPGAAYIKYNGPEPKNEEEAVKQTARVHSSHHHIHSRGTVPLSSFSLSGQ